MGIMGIIKQHSPFLGNANNINGYLQGLADGQKRGMEAMKIFACVEFIKILREICPEVVQTDDDIRTLKSDFLKRLEK